MTQLAGKIALVTGAGSGMGRAIAQRFADEGCKVVGVGRTEDKLKETCAGHKGTGSLCYRVADVGSNDAVLDLVGWVVAEVGAPDILVNNAGVNTKKRKVSELSIEDWNYLVQVNLNGAFHMIHALLPMMRARGGGLIINISSISGKRASMLGGAAYSAAKFGLNALSSVVTQEECKNGIRSSIICPGEVDTPILLDRPVPVTDEHRARILRPEDVAEAALFIARLPARAHVPELIITPTVQPYA